MSGQTFPSDCLSPLCLVGGELPSKHFIFLSLGPPFQILAIKEEKLTKQSKDVQEIRKGEREMESLVGSL